MLKHRWLKLNLRIFIRQVQTLPKTIQVSTTATPKYSDAKPYGDIPSPPKVPILGSAYLLASKEYRDHIVTLYIDLTKKYGPIFNLSILGFKTLVLTHPDDARDVLSSEGEFPQIPSLTQVLGKQRLVCYFQPSVNTLGA